MLTRDEYNHERLLFNKEIGYLMKQLFLSVLFNLLLVSMSHASESLTFINPWIPETPPGARVMAGYMEIHNPGSQEIEITSVTSPAFNSVEMHLSKDVGGVAKMLQQKTLSIPAKGKLVLKASSFHLMLMKPKKRLLNGDKAQLTFSLSNGDKINISAPIKNYKKKKQKLMKCAAGKCGGG